MKTFSKRPKPGENARHVVCVVCGSDSPVNHWGCDGFAFVKCRRCGHIYQDPQPEPGDLIERYDAEYSQYEIENSENFLNLMLLGLRDVDFFQRIEMSSASRTFLDIGCATGALLQHMQGRGFAVQGVEVCEPAAEYGRVHRGVPIEVGTLDSVFLDRSQYGAIHFSHVIEHVPDPREFLTAVRARLEPTGLVVIVTPNSSGLQPRLFGSTWRSAIADHVHLFGYRNLFRLLTETGYKVIATKTWGGLGIGTAPGWVKRPVDTMAKVFGFGDVMLFLAVRQSDHDLDTTARSS